ncbi:hypothetical protein M3P05_20610 [Sansalvadorimonas sp. 2012CJ34-2]|uniref:Uncharacterized protein n=1 Tax=Parendozoicomonas callyspongiae TaxID=2942213 RepID=A0ABT0PLQ8_9GAMM|nr:hypothetical protein [Sansalvadorimonas sp. 2012CJ34-2]MCL6272322.1 hypothetical protein [Sansalvadorimonas sp. 2012CJ34-2]
MDVSKEKWKVRTYEGIEKNKIIDAAREVIRLSDPDEIKFENTLDGFNAERIQLSYMVVATNQDYFKYQFVTREQGNKVQARIDIEENIMKANVLTLGMPTFDIGKPETSYVYNLFYSRMDYLLGLKDNWYTCKDAISKIKAKFGKADNVKQLGMSSLCGALVDDRVPGSLAKAQSEELFN